MVADRILRIGSGYDFTSDLPIDINMLRVGAKITADTEDDIYFKARVQSAMQQIESECRLKLFFGTFIAQWTSGKIGSYGNKYRPLTLPGIDPTVQPMTGSRSTIDITSLMTGVDGKGNFEIYPARSWPEVDTTLEFTAGFPQDGTRITHFSNPHIRTAIEAICRYTYYQDEADFKLIEFLISKIQYVSIDAR